MKIVISLFAVAIFAIGAAAQDAKVLAEITASSDLAVTKNAPFSADAVSESVQILSDGNRIVHSSTSKFYRNSEGRTRREIQGGTGSGLGMLYNYEPGVSIMDPSGSRLVLDSTMRTARLMSLMPMRELNITGAAKLTDEQRAAIEKLKGDMKITDATKLTDEQRAALVKLKGDLKITAPLIISSTSTAMATGVGGSVGGNVGTFVYSASPGPKYETRSEDLGSNNVEGVTAEGTRRITTIPAGAIGNERPIETIYERWFSKDLGVVVYSKTTDPRFGEQTYRLTNIVRAEPDSSLFTLPQGYRLVTEPGGTYRVSTAGRGESEIVTVKAATKAKPQ